jgi:uncharacterized membrane protein YhhN
MKPKILPVLYFILLATECIAVLTGANILHFVSKPLLMPVLALYLVSFERDNHRVRSLLLGALLFSWLGDAVLMLDKMFGSLFIYGLLAFLIAHIFYILYFLRIRRSSAGAQSGVIGALIVLAYMAVFYLYLFPYLGGLKIPVLVYATAISLMLISSFRAFDAETGGKISVAGTLIFALSDSILAFNRFVSPFEYAPIAIMLTYGIAQFLIVKGLVKSVPSAVADG